MSYFNLKIGENIFHTSPLLICIVCTVQQHSCCQDVPNWGRNAVPFGSAVQNNQRIQLGPSAIIRTQSYALETRKNRYYCEKRLQESFSFYIIQGL